MSFSHLWTDHPLVRSVIGGLTVGSVGSSAYLTALLLGFLGDSAITQLRPKFERLRGAPPRAELSLAKVLAFVALGGGIALVFQWAQGVVFAPIQALVLGATWPTVISNFLAKSGQTDSDRIRDLAERVEGRTGQNGSDHA